MQQSFWCIFCCSGYFSMWKCIFLGISLMYYMHREPKDVMYLVLQYCLSKNIFPLFSLYMRTWRHLDKHWILAAIWHLLAFSFYFLMETILFLYSSGNQHPADLPFHTMCYRCCLHLPQFDAHVVWIDSVTCAMFYCILYCKSLLAR